MVVWLWYRSRNATKRCKLGTVKNEAYSSQIQPTEFVIKMCVSTSPSISWRCEDSCRVDTTAGWVSDLSQTIDVCLPITHTNLDSPPLAMCVCVCRGVI